MKQKFRRNKPPLKLMEKGDRRAILKIAYIAPDGSIFKRVCDMTEEEKEDYRHKAIERALAVAKKQEAAIPKPEVFVLVERKPAPDIKHGQPVKVKTGDHAGEIAVVIGPSKTLPGRLGVLTLGGLVHYKLEDLEVQK
ncbi:MAG: hypothetical protein PHI12_13780 [Dehalococcoidales bacterium]|jgi:hypothetical protein|nr:hypothetical protein [Dehalococcoidales bacterium]